MKKVVLFCRVSSIQQNLEAQIKAVKSEAKRDGFKESEMLLVQGKESAIRLKEDERVTLQELNQIIEANPSIEAIYLFAVDRLARRVSIIQSICEEMSERGINIVFLHPSKFSTLQKNEVGKKVINPIGQMYLTFLALGASMEMSIKNERFAAARVFMKSQGQLLTAKCPYGYMRGKDGFPKINEKEASIVRRVFDDYLKDGSTFQSVGMKLVHLGIWPPISRVGIVKKVRNIIQNSVYSLGVNGESNVQFQPIVDAETQKKCQEKATDLTKPKRETKHKWLAKGKVFIKLQDTDRMYQMFPNAGNCAYQFVDQRSLSAPIKNINVSANILDYIVWSEGSLHWRLQSMHNAATAPIEIENLLRVEKGKLVEINENIRRYTEAKERAGRSFVLGVMSEETVISVKREIDVKIKPWLDKKAASETEIERLERILKEASEPSFNLNSSIDDLDDDGKLEIINKMVDRMIVTKTATYEYEIEIKTNTSFPTRTWRYNASGGKKRLFFKDVDETWTEVSNLVPQRFVNLRLSKKQN